MSTVARTLRPASTTPEQAARMQPCAVCFARPGRPCRTAPDRDHLARFLDAHANGKITRHGMCGVLDRIEVLTKVAFVPSACAWCGAGHAPRAAAGEGKPHDDCQHERHNPGPGPGLFEHVTPSGDGTGQYRHVTNIRRSPVERKPGTVLLVVASGLLLLLAAAQGYVSWRAQFAFVATAEDAPLAAGVEALGLDVAAVIFALLGLAHARMGKSARVERTLDARAPSGRWR